MMIHKVEVRKIDVLEVESYSRVISKYSSARVLFSVRVGGTSLHALDQTRRERSARKQPTEDEICLQALTYYYILSPLPVELLS